MIIDKPFVSGDYILFTDSWHPTINPSSRMPVHHLRYNSLFTGHTGILTEVPRRNGGSTLREMVFSGQQLAVKELNTPVEWFPGGEVAMTHKFWVISEISSQLGRRAVTTMQKAHTVTSAGDILSLSHRMLH